MGRRDGAVDPRLVRELTAALAPIGPDGSHFWVGEQVGLGHALLKVPGNRPNKHYPCSLDNQVWIAADVRLDARAELLTALRSAGQRVDPSASDAELVLQAYHAWGDSCLEHVLGDFALAIWDGRRGALFCARDHFGVVPLYYAVLDDGLIVSNALDCVRLHPAVTNRLNELAIGDYLVFACNQDQGTTFFADVQKLPPAHALIWTDGRVRSKRYWELQPADPQDREPTEIVSGFVEVLRAAVGDRLPAGPAAILMSGGLDSTTIAALASEVSTAGAESTVTGHVTGFSRLIPDEERQLAVAAAQALGVPIRIYEGEPYLLARQGPRAWLAPPEPRYSLHVNPGHEILEAVAAERGCVFLSGEGGDLVLHPDSGRRLAWLPIRIRVALRRLRGAGRGSVDWPFDSSWLNQDFVRRIDLADRWDMVNERIRVTRKSRAVTDSPFSESVLSSGHAEFSGLPLVFRYPFFDVRLLEFLQTIPPQRWLEKKGIIREAMRGRLPDAILERRKSPLARHFYPALAKELPDPWIEEIAVSVGLTSYVALQPLLDAIQQAEAVGELYIQRVILPLSLAFWLHERASNSGLARARDKAAPETVREAMPEFEL